MENKESEVEKVNEIVVSGRIAMGNVFNFRTQKDDVKPVITLEHPFDEYEPDITVSIKDINRRSKFMYRAKDKIRTEDISEISVTAKFELLEFMDTVKRQKANYLAIYLNSPFDDTTEFVTVGGEVKGELLLLARERLNLITIEEQKQRARKKQ